MKCTSPCTPHCENEATHDLLNKGSGVHLGFNCEAHINPLIALNDGRDYVAKPLPPAQIENPTEGKDVSQQ